MITLKKCALAVIIALIIVSCKSWTRVDEQEQDVAAQDQYRATENFGQGWQFQRLIDEGDTERAWEEVTVPHTVKIEPLVVNDQWQGSSIYRKSFLVEDRDYKKWFFHFEGVMQEAMISINGTQVLTHKGGFLPFTVDATSFLIEGQENVFEVQVFNEDNTSIPPGKALEVLDFNMYGGIYRPVYLIKTNDIYITDAVHANVVNGGGILFHPETVNEGKARGFVKVHVQNDSPRPALMDLRFSLTNANGETREFKIDKPDLNPTVFAGEDSSISLGFEIDNPLLWSPASPNLYTLKVDILADGEIVDSRELRVGIRDLRLTGEGFYLNGKKIFINGTNRHQEYPYIGYALSNEAQYRDAYKIKQAGFDFVRLSHYPHSTAFMEACDELGLLVMNAIPGWQYYEEGEFVENAIQDIKDLARRDRNHPSVIFWENSLNESGMPEEFMERANEVLRAELPYDDTYTAGWIDHPSYDLFIPARQHAQPPNYWSGYNKPNRPILIAEYGDWEYYAQNAGFNQTAYSDLQEEERTSRQLRGAGEARLLQQALNYQEAFNSNLKGKQTIGHANWLMYDYNRGYADDLEASGISDIFRIPKFSFYFYQSQKPPYVDQFVDPMVFIASFWTPNSNPKVRVFSNTEEVALYLNDVLLERKSPERNQFSDELPYPPFSFNIGAFKPGTLRAVGYINGEEVATYSVRTPGKATNLDVKVDISNKPIATATQDVVFVYAILRDENGTVVPGANNRVTFTVEGETGSGEIVGGNVIEAEAGIATVLVRTNPEPGSLIIKATSPGLEESTIILK